MNWFSVCFVGGSGVLVGLFTFLIMTFISLFHLFLLFDCCSFFIFLLWFVIVFFFFNVYLNVCVYFCIYTFVQLPACLSLPCKLFYIFFFFCCCCFFEFNFYSFLSLVFWYKIITSCCLMFRSFTFSFLII